MFDVLFCMCFVLGGEVVDEFFEFGGDVFCEDEY